MLVDKFIGNRIPAERKIKPFEPDPSSDLVILLKKTTPTQSHPQPWEIAEVIR